MHGGPDDERTTEGQILYKLDQIRYSVFIILLIVSVIFGSLIISVIFTSVIFT